jgi:RimJ/RimL family protein N-acetyltransferase
VPRQARLSADALKAAPRQLRTPRLRLESAREHHAPAMFESLQASLADWRFIDWARPEHGLPWAQDFCRRSRASMEAGEDLTFHAFLEDGRHLGRIDLHSFDFDAPRCEIGYVADSRLRGRGLMREAVEAVVRLGFELGLMRIHAMSDARNERALQFAQSLGFEPEGLLRCWERDPQGTLCNVVMMARYHPDSLRT